MANKKCSTCNREVQGEPRDGTFARGPLDRCPACGQPGAPETAFANPPKKKAKRA